MATQVFTRKNITGLKKGNREAAFTFTINNRLQDLVNLCFELQTKLTNSPNTDISRESLTDSLTMLGYNANVLDQINLNNEVKERFKKLNSFITNQLDASFAVIQSKGPEKIKKIATLRQLQIGDSVYATALAIQKYLERDLQSTLNNNTETSGKLTNYNRTLAIIAIAAVLILGTIIINRHLRQVQLISALEKATEEAKKSAMVKDQFLANMSHEIRTPLNAIKGFSRLMSKTNLNNEQQQYADIINNASGSLIHIVNDILDISKIEAGKLRIETKEFDLGKLLQTVEYMFLNIAAEKRLEYSQHINDNVPLNLKGDPERLSQILINLISNGIKFTPTGYVHTIVSLRKTEQKKVWIRFAIEDSGVGIPSEKQEKIFQRFEQLETRGDNVTQGTGLGLSIVKNLAILMGGQVSVLSEYGKGAVFQVELPFELGDLVVEKKYINEDIIASYSYVGASVLIVEDNKMNQLLLKHTLTDLNIATDIVSNGQEALDILGKKNFDLILMDIQMPIMDGYATIGKIRRSGAIKTPVVAMTAYAMPGEKEKCLAAGMNGYVAKPVRYAELDKMLQEFLNTKRQKLANDLSYQKLQQEFLLQLAGGDKAMARIILQEIKKEIPEVRKRLEQFKGNKNLKELRNTCHHMVSTFAPMGNETEVMIKIRQLNNASSQDKDKNVVSVNELLMELNKLETEIQSSINTIG